MRRGGIIAALIGAGLTAYAVRKALNNVSRDISDWARIIEAEEAAALAEYQSPSADFTPLCQRNSVPCACSFDRTGGGPFFFHGVHGGEYGEG